MCLSGVLSSSTDVRCLPRRHRSLAPPLPSSFFISRDKVSEKHGSFSTSGMPAPSAPLPYAWGHQRRGVLASSGRRAPCCDLPRQTTTRRNLLLQGAALTGLAASAGLLPWTAPPCNAAALVDEDVATAVFQAVGPSVASIAVVRPVGGVQVREVVGSGVVWDPVGPHVLTNFHIIPPLQGVSALLEVTVQDAATGAFVTLPARVAGSDSLHDLAVLRLLPPAASQQPQPPPSIGGGGGDGDGGAVGGAVLPSLTPIRVSRPGDLQVGQFVYSLGCVAADPAAPVRSLSAGLVSGLGRSIPSPVGARIYGVVQTEAVINAANSGGPLVDSFGRLVGLSTAVGAAQSSSARGSGVGFALPVELLLDLVPKIIVYGNPYGKK